MTRIIIFIVLVPIIGFLFVKAYDAMAIEQCHRFSNEECKVIYNIK